MEKNFKDHDLLITLNVKVDALTQKLDIISDGVNAKLSDHEKRIGSVESTISKFDPKELTPRFFKLEQEVHDFKTTTKVYRLVAGAGGGAVFFILTQIPSWVRIVLRM